MLYRLEIEGSLIRDSPEVLHCVLSLTFISFLYNNMCTYNTTSSHTDHLEIQKRYSEESLLTFVNLFLIVSLTLDPLLSAV